MQRSLKSRALQLLAQRDQSRLELRRKLLRHARARRAKEPPPAMRMRSMRSTSPPRSTPCSTGSRRTAFSRASGSSRRASMPAQSRFGTMRIKSELAQHGVDLPPELARSLAASELERAAPCASAVSARRPPTAGRAAQSRFLLGRGFAPELVQRLMRRLRGPPGARRRRCRRRLSARRKRVRHGAPSARAPVRSGRPGVACYISRRFPGRAVARAPSLATVAPTSR